MNKNKFSKYLITLLISFTILFIIATFTVFWKTGSEPSTLVGCWFAFLSTELVALSSIKKAKVKKESVGDENE